MWVKQGRIINGNAQLPVVEIIDNNYFNLYFSERNPETNESSIWVQRFLLNGMSPINNRQLVLSSGPIGCFDDCGVMPSCIFKDCHGLTYMCYTGWSRSEKVPYRHSIGLLVKKGDVWVKEKSPIIGQDRLDSYLCNSAFVYRNEIYYCSGTGWLEDFPVYNISKRSLLRPNLVSNELKWNVVDNLGVQAISRPCVVNLHGRTFVFYSYKTKNTNYKMGVAVEKHQYLSCERVDVGNYILEKSSEIGDWDYEMVCYPYVVEINGKAHMFYNGNGYGASGVGYATWVD